MRSWWRNPSRVNRQVLLRPGERFGEISHVFALVLYVSRGAGLEGLAGPLP